MADVTMAQALNRALRDSLMADPDVVVYGEDVGPLGGVFRITDGLTAEFGEQRCFDSPLAESGIVGTAIGMAMYGQRPVVEMQFDAFGYPAFEQVVSHVAKMRNRTRGQVGLPIVIRIPYGGGIGGVEHHSDSSEAYYAHTPGLRVVTPATPADAYSMLREAIESPDPVVFLEPKRRYWTKAGLDLPVRTEPMDRAVVRRSGSDVTLIAYGPMVATALETADAAEENGIGVEVVDLRSLAPFDDATVTASVRRTGRALVVHEAATFGGYGAEVAARVTERCFHYLEAPVLRVGGFDIPYPPPKLERHHLPGVDRILDAIGRLQWESEWVSPDQRDPEGAAPVGAEHPGETFAPIARYRMGTGVS
ncbi:pyruvate dehydrogenase E1 component beta subunit [Spinactinospora alkalitolerans]|uniref:3-methyl-2-oxobutanoate dehydrogenase (2-methylpropanoyl-transferring) n=1 Tax=Spinactinospora alkalitolerans TaxID=687207 RepID=A0A852TYN1_9ACTN|nr:alpha-ketoacid dehydrogenase subunit beta [Spinactinospora alkalitolerans]NYE48911.1 pyruvate dehydrogenase E1 component beta subunit [Spinactinospora alkalitolerans]